MDLPALAALKAGNDELIHLDTSPKPKPIIVTNIGFKPISPMLSNIKLIKSAASIAPARHRSDLKRDNKALFTSSCILLLNYLVI